MGRENVGRGKGTRRENRSESGEEGATELSRGRRFF